MPKEQLTIEDVKKPGFNPVDFLSKKPEIDDSTPPPDKKEEDVEDKSKKEDDKNTNNPPPDKKTKDDNIKALRQAKEAAEKELNDIKAENEKLKKLKSFEKIRDYISSKKGGQEVTDEDVEAYIAKNKTRKSELEKISNDYKEKDLALREFSIEHSDEWKNVYQKKIVQTSDILRTSILNVDANGQVRAPVATQKFIKTVVGFKKDENGVERPLTPIEIKSALAAFKKEFEDEAGVDYEAPTLSELVKANEDFHKAAQDANNARRNWQKTLDENRKAKAYEESKRREREITQEVEGRNFLVSKLKEDPEIKTVRDIVGDEIDTFIKEEHQFMNDALQGKEVQLRGYDSMIATMAKAKSVPKLIAEIQRLKKEYEDLKDSIDSDSQRHIGSNSSRKNTNDVNDDGEIKLKPGEKYDPLKFLDKS